MSVFGSVFPCFRGTNLKNSDDSFAVGLDVSDCRPLLFSRVGTKDTRRVESIPAIITTTQPRVFRRSRMERKRGGGRGQLATLSVSDRGGREAKRRRKFSCIVEN